MGKRILVADDSQTIQQAFQLALHGDDVTLISARSFDLAAAAARDQAPDLVIADITLGDKSGYDLCAAIKGAGGSMPIWILESKQTPYDETRGVTAGADGRLLKPFDSTKLLEAIQAVSGNGVAAPVRRTAPTMDAVPSVAPKSDTAPQPEFEDESSYGEFSIDGPKGGETTGTPAPVVAAPASVVAAPAPVVAAPAPVVAAPAPVVAPMRAAAPPMAAPIPRPTASVPAIAPTPPPVVRTAAPVAPAAAPPRPSLIPGLRPGGGPRPPLPPSAAMKPSARPLAQPAPFVPPAPIAFSPPTAAPVSIGHAHTVPHDLPGPATPPPVLRAAVAIAVVASDPEIETRATSPTIIPTTPIAAKIGSAVDAKLAAISDKGPEYAVIAKLSREIIEQIVWEVVPELAELIIKEHVERLAKK